MKPSAEPPVGSSFEQTSEQTSEQAPSTRPPGGLGQGLARILRRSGGGRSSHQGLHHLLGPGLPTTSRLVRDFVVETALGAIADGFEAEAVVIARRDDGGQLAAVSSRIPPSWARSTNLTFELFGMLWYWLDRVSYTSGSDYRAGSDDAAPRRAPDGEAGPLGAGDRHLWIGAQGLAVGHLAAAVVRDTSFTEVEQVTLNRLVRSVAAALGGEAPALPPGTVIEVDTRLGPDGQWAVDVGLDLGTGQCRESASAPDQELAVATAALRLCVPGTDEDAYEVTFAGHTELDGSRVTIVLVDDERTSPLLGLAITDPGDVTGAVEAVFSAFAASRPAGPTAEPTRS